MSFNTVFKIITPLCILLLFVCGMSQSTHNRLVALVQRGTRLEQTLSWGKDGRVDKVITSQFRTITSTLQYDDDLQKISISTGAVPKIVSYKNGLLQLGGYDSLAYDYKESVLSYFQNLRVSGATTLSKFYFRNNNVVRIEYYAFSDGKVGTLGRVEEFEYDDQLSPGANSIGDTARWRNLTWNGNYAYAFIVGMMSADFLSVNNIISSKEVYVASGRRGTGTDIRFRYDYKNGKPTKKYWASGSSSDFKLQDEFVYE